MDPTKLLLLAIAILGVILVALLIYLLVIAPRGRSKNLGRTPAAPRPLSAPEEQAKQPITHVPGMDSVNEHASNPAATAREKAGPTDVTPPAGISRSDLRELLTDTGTRRPADGDTLTPAGGMGSLAAPRTTVDRDTAPQPSLAKPPTPSEPPRKRTVALNASFFDDEPTERPSIAPPAPGVSPARRVAPPVPAVATPRSVPTPATAPTVTPTPRSAPSTPAAAIDPLADILPEVLPVEDGQTLIKKDAPSAPEGDGPTEQLLSPALLPERFRDKSLPPHYRVEAFTNLIAQCAPDERPLYIVEAINDDLDALKIVALQQITGGTHDALLDEVIPLVESPSADVALVAVQALANIGGPVVEQALLAALECPHANVKTYATQALLNNATPELEEQLHEMVNEDDNKQVEIAANLLAKLGGDLNAEVLEVRASLTPSNSPLQAKLQEAAAQARTVKRAAPAPSDDPFGTGESVDLAGGLEEFELSLDPELFNPKS